MEFSYDCLMCHVNQARRVGEIMAIENERMEALIRKVLRHMSDMSYEASNPATMARTWEIISEVTGNDNPYKVIKETFNAHMMSIYETLYDQLKGDPRSLDKAIHLAIEGNIIDFGAKHSFSKEDTLERLLCEDKDNLAIDMSRTLLTTLAEAKSLLYIGDNCGEIVMDKLVIRLIREAYPDICVHYAVRGKPVLNDVTMTDAEQVGMDEVAEVISNGSGAPGTVLDMVSDDFRKLFDKADLIISKGQGNYESMSPLMDQRIYFLFMAKCQTVAKSLGVPEMSKLCIRA